MECFHFFVKSLLADEFAVVDHSVHCDMSVVLAELAADTICSAT